MPRLRVISLIFDGPIRHLVDFLLEYDCLRMQNCYSSHLCEERKVQTGIKPGMEHKFRLEIASFENLTHAKVFEQILN